MNFKRILSLTENTKYTTPISKKNNLLRSPMVSCCSSILFRRDLCSSSLFAPPFLLATWGGNKYHILPQYFIRATWSAKKYYISKPRSLPLGRANNTITSQNQILPRILPQYFLWAIWSGTKYYSSKPKLAPNIAPIFPPAKNIKLISSPIKACNKYFLLAKESLPVDICPVQFKY